MKRDLKVAPQNQAEEAPAERPIAGFYVPIQLMDQIIGYIGQGPWIEVNDFINNIRNSIQPIYAKQTQPVPNEAENQTAPTN